MELIYSIHRRGSHQLRPATVVFCVTACVILTHFSVSSSENCHPHHLPAALIYELSAPFRGHSRSSTKRFVLIKCVFWGIYLAMTDKALWSLRDDLCPRGVEIRAGTYENFLKRLPAFPGCISRDILYTECSALPPRSGSS